MNTQKETQKQIAVNLSPSSVNTYYQSPLLFYLTYIAKIPDDTPVPVCYGLSGSIVHACLEKYAKKEIDRDSAYAYLLTEWGRQNLTTHKDIYDKVLDPMEYLAAMMHGLTIVDQHEGHICEEKITLPLKESPELKIGLKGIIDLQAIEKTARQQVILDYKTSNSISADGTFERQALFYNLLLYKKKNIIPAKTSFHYLKLKLTKEYTFTEKRIKEFENELNAIADQILIFGTDIGNYPVGNIDDLFNSKKQACHKEIERREMQKMAQSHH